MPALPHQADVTADRLLTATQVADRLACSLRTVWRMVRRGELVAPVRLNRKLVRWKAGDLDRWLRELR